MNEFYYILAYIDNFGQGKAVYYSSACR